MDEADCRPTPQHPVTVAVNFDESDVEMIVLDDDEDAILSLSLDSPQMRNLRWFVELQRLPSRFITKSPTRWDTIAQLLVIVLVFLLYLNTIGVFHYKTLEGEEMRLTLTSFKNLVWCLRHTLYAVLGLFYFRSTHIDVFVCSLKLNSRSLKKAKRWLRNSCSLMVVFSVIVPVLVLRLVEMQLTPKADKKKKFSTIEVIVNTSLSIAVRLLSMPMVIVFTIVFALLYFQVRQFKKQIQSWPVDKKPEARNFLVDILVQCKKAERGFQPFLIVHITILLLVIIPGVLSFAERVRSEGTYEATRWASLADQEKTFINNLISKETNGSMNKKISSPILIIKIPTNEKTQTGSTPLPPIKFGDKNAKIRITLQSLAFLANLLSLYLPLTLLGKINKAIKRIAETIQCLKFEDQQEGGFLFQSRQELDEMLKDLSNAHGVHILGMEITIIKTWLLAVMMPLFTLLLHIMFKHVDLAA